jgi:transglutaminase-like putative cysteine protease
MYRRRIRPATSYEGAPDHLLKPRKLLGVAIVAAWMGMIGLHVRREYFPAELTELADATASLAPGTSFYTLRMGDRAVGQATSRLDTIGVEGFELEDRMILELPAFGQTGSAVARTYVKLSRALVMQSFSFSLDSDVGKFEATGEVLADSTLSVTITSQGSTQKIDYKLASPPVFSAVVPIRMAMGEGLEVGKRVRFPVFDPTTLSSRTVEVRVLEADTIEVPDSVAYDSATTRWRPARTDTIPVWKIAEVFGGMSVESWIDEDGRVVRASSPLGFSMEKTEYELAMQSAADDRKRPAAANEDVIFSTAIRSNVDLGETAENPVLKFRLSGVELAGFDLEGGRQTLRGDTLIVHREIWDGLQAGYDLPYKRMDLRDELAAEPLIQSDDPRIVEAAARAVGRRPYRSINPRRAASELSEYVHQLLKKEITVSVPSALQVLESRRGDCNEHTVLYVALARSLGLPARTAVGLVYLRGSFYYHAWPEVWLGEWVAVDPTFGQTPADAAHLRFVIGGLAQQVEIARLIGQLKIEVIQ